MGQRGRLSPHVGAKLAILVRHRVKLEQLNSSASSALREYDGTATEQI